jgi:tetratricopeptide (TPR) repeat protein
MNAQRFWVAVWVGTLLLVAQPSIASEAGISGNPATASDWNDLERAIAIYDEAIRLDPENPAVYSDRAHYYGMKGNLDKAIADYTKAVRLDPHRAASYWERGCTYTELGEIDKAVADLTEAIRLNAKLAETTCPKLAAECCVRGAAYWKLGNLDKALADYSHAVQFNPQSAAAYDGRGSIHGQKGNLNQAIADFDKAIHLDSNSASIYGDRGWVYNQNGEFEKALADYETALHLAPGSITAHNSLAWFQATCPEARLRDGKSAVRHATLACQLSGNKDAACLDTLAAAYAESGDFQNAKQWQSKAIEAETDKTLKEEFRSRLQLYEEGKPYRDKKKDK